MKLESIRALFAPTIFPSFPFAQRQWLAVAFDRDNYDNTRMPQWWFEAAAESFDATQSEILMGPCGPYEAGDKMEIIKVPFEWTKYRLAAQDELRLCPEFILAGSRLDWGVWADPEITVWGGSSAGMNLAISRLGGKGRVLQLMQEDFGVSQSNDQQELISYLKLLIGADVGS
jgi:hypothetical protein